MPRKPTSRNAPYSSTTILSRVSAPLAFALLCAAGCAKPGLPGGGPTDTLAPAVVGTEPSSGALSVDPSTPIEVEFSEEMDRLSVERAVSMVPAVALQNLRWRGRTLIALPEEALPDSTTVVFEVGVLAKDYHGVALAAPFSLAFSTGAELDRGTIEGTVSAGGDAVPRAIVWACPGSAVPDSSGFIHPCGYTTATDENGSFRMEHVRASRMAYAIVAFLDGDGDRRYLVAGETGAVLEQAAHVDTPGDSAVGIIVPIEPPRAGGRPEAEEETE